MEESLIQFPELFRYIQIEWGKFDNGRYQHNFPMLRPKGYKPKFGPDADPNILLIDPWRTLLPQAYLPSPNPPYYPTETHQGIPPK